MTARERILAIRLLEKQEKNPEYANQIGIRIDIVKKDQTTEERKTCCGNHSLANK